MIGVSYRSILLVLVRVIIETSLHGLSNIIIIIAVNLVISLMTYFPPPVSGLLNIQFIAVSTL
jgi:hypothetical protein